MQTCRIPGLLAAAAIVGVVHAAMAAPTIDPLQCSVSCDSMLGLAGSGAAL